MAWSAEFAAAISARNLYPLYLLEGVPGQAYRPDCSAFKVASFRGADGYSDSIRARDCSIRYGQLTPISWTASYSSASFALLFEPHWIRRGDMVRLLVGFPGWEIADFEPVWLGVVTDRGQRGQLWELTAVGIEGALQSRFEHDDSILFDDLDATTATAQRLVGGGTVTVSSTTGFERETGGDFLLLIEPASGDPFYLRATGSTATTFTGVTGGHYGTTDATVNIGDVVKEAVLVEGHPLQVAQKLLVSTGAGDNGSADTLPQSWGLGIPADLVDDADITQWIALTSPSSGADDWALIATEEQQDAAAFLASFLGSAGFFVAQRQGLITVRGVIDTSGDDPPTTMPVTDDHIVRVQSYESYPSLTPVEYRVVRAVSGSSSGTRTETGLDTRPVRDELEYDASAWVWSNEANWRVSIRERLAPYAQRVPELASLELVGWEWGELALGDGVAVDSTLVTSRRGPFDGAFRGQPCLIIGGGVDWFGAGAEFSVLCPSPYSASEVA